MSADRTDKAQGPGPAGTPGGGDDAPAPSASLGGAAIGAMAGAGLAGPVGAGVGAAVGAFVAGVTAAEETEEAGPVEVVRNGGAAEAQHMAQELPAVQEVPAAPGARRGEGAGAAAGAPAQAEAGGGAAPRAAGDNA
ncbi:MAG: hypothetical protein J3K34DRAFT_471025 [Monoraphidium minutum]|nr:MAG: hypothetical protein J3K34DRAFT_471025 [Monoraphidium minutum]